MGIVVKRQHYNRVLLYVKSTSWEFHLNFLSFQDIKCLFEEFWFLIIFKYKSSFAFDMSEMCEVA